MSTTCRPPRGKRAPSCCRRRRPVTIAHPWDATARSYGTSSSSVGCLPRRPPALPRVAASAGRRRGRSGRRASPGPASRRRRRPTTALGVVVAVVLLAPSGHLPAAVRGAVTTWSNGPEDTHFCGRASWDWTRDDAASASCAARQNCRSGRTPVARLLDVASCFPPFDHTLLSARSGRAVRGPRVPRNSVLPEHKLRHQARRGGGLRVREGPHRDRRSHREPPRPAAARLRRPLGRRDGSLVLRRGAGRRVRALRDALPPRHGLPVGVRICRCRVT